MDSQNTPALPTMADTAATAAVVVENRGIESLQRLLGVLLYFLMLLTMMGFTGRLFWWSDYLAHPRLQLASGLGCLGLVLLAMNNWPRFAIACAGVALNFIAITSAIPDLSPPPNINGIPPGRIKVIQVNVNVNNGNSTAILDWISKEQPDILILTEANRTWLPMLDALVAKLPYQRMVNHSRQYGMALLSRFPLDRAESGVAGPASLPVLKVELETPLGRIALVGVHGNAPVSGRESRARDHYFAQVSAMVQTNGLPTILAGDFNATPWSSGFESIRLLPNLQPSSLSAPATWPAAFGALGIPTNHILLSIPYAKPMPIEFSRLETGPALPGMSHLPLVAELIIP